MHITSVFLPLGIILSLLISPTAFVFAKANAVLAPSAPSEMLVTACLREVRKKLEIIEDRSDQSRFSEISMDPNPSEVKPTEIPDMASEGGKRRKRKSKVVPQPKPAQKGFEIFLAGKAKDPKKLWDVKGKCLVSAKKIIFATYELK